MNDYNTNKPTLILKEYGRNIQKLVEYLKTIEDKEKRTLYASVLVDLMKQINPAVKETLENSQKLWDDLYIMADFDIDIDGPFPVPSRDILIRKPERLNYKASEIKYKHYGRNIQLLIQKAKEIEDPEEKEAAVLYIGRLMKSFHTIWNRENADDEIVLKNIKVMSNNELSFDIEKVRKENLFEINIKERKSSSSRSNSNQKGRKGGSQGRRRRN
jgi:hypothetical protein